MPSALVLFALLLAGHTIASQAPPSETGAQQMATLLAEAPAGAAPTPVAAGATLAQALQAAAVEPKLVS